MTLDRLLDTGEIVEGVSFDRIEFARNSTQDIMSYYEGTELVLTLTLTYTNASKSELLRVEKT